MFGAPSAPFGASAPSAFGSSPAPFGQQPQQNTGGFGQPAANTGFGGGFGQTAQPQQNAFGAAPSTGFGQPQQNAFGAPSTNTGFGQPAQSGGGLFGQGELLSFDCGCSLDFFILMKLICLFGYPSHSTSSLNLWQPCTGYSVWSKACIRGIIRLSNARLVYTVIVHCSLDFLM